MEIAPQDLVGFTGDPKTVVTASRGAGHTSWRVDWVQHGEKMSVGLRVTDQYLKAVKYGAVTPLLELQRLIAASVDGTTDTYTRLASTYDEQRRRSV